VKKAPPAAYMPPRTIKDRGAPPPIPPGKLALLRIASAAIPVSCSLVSPTNQNLTASSRTVFPCIPRAGAGSADRDGMDSVGMAGAVAGARRAGSPASHTPPDSHSRPHPAAPRPSPPGGRGFRSSPGDRRIHQASAPSHSAPRRIQAPARSCPGVRYRTPSGDTAACFHNTYSQRLSIAAPSLSVRRYC
jgi:hypothetical protein